MKFDYLPPKASRQKGYALMTVMITSTLGLIVLGGALAWTSHNARMTQRHNQYYSALAAAEASSEKALSHIARDFQMGGQALVGNNLATYKNAIPTASESSYWNSWEFSDGQGNTALNHVARIGSWSWRSLDSQYAGLGAFAANYQILSQARELQLASSIQGAVQQDFQIASIPIFQFAIFYNIPMEISPGPVLTVTGRVHSNQDIYAASNEKLIFNSDVTASGNIIFARAPGDTRSYPSGTVIFQGNSDAQVRSLNLPIGTNTTPAAVQQILEPPPGSEDPLSPMGQQRFYNKADLVINVTDTNIFATTGLFNGFAQTIPIGDFASTNAAFMDNREGKTVLPLDIDIAKLLVWNSTNASLKPALTGASLPEHLRIIYVHDTRTGIPSNKMPAVRVKNGVQLPPLGLTVATPLPLYVQGYYNCPTSAHRGTTNTSNTLPSALLGDAISIQSSSWNDSNSTKSLSNRVAGHTTINAAFLSGIVETSTYGSYSGGTENYPRFMEKWSGKTFTYNGSMVILFPSVYATGQWVYGNNVYEAPTRNWAFDINFLDPLKLPPGTPEARTIIRSSWKSIRGSLTASP